MSLQRQPTYEDLDMVAMETCIGVQMSMIIAKLALVEILQHLSVVPCRETSLRSMFCILSTFLKRLYVLYDF